MKKVMRNKRYMSIEDKMGEIIRKYTEQKAIKVGKLLGYCGSCSGMVMDGDMDGDIYHCVRCGEIGLPGDLERERTREIA